MLLCCISLPVTPLGRPGRRQTTEVSFLMTDKLGCAIWGAGWVADEHLNAYMANPNCEVVAVGSRTEASARRAAAKCGAAAAAVYTDYDQLLKDDRIQVLSICTPSHLHVEEGVKAAAAGKHMVMEKPMAVDVAGVKALRDALRESGVKSLVSFVLHWCPSLINARTLVQSGAIGDIFYVEGDYWHGVSDWYSGWEWARTKASGGSAFLFGGCHAVDAVRWITGLEVTSVCAFAGGWDKRYEYPATVVGAVTWSNGAVGKLSTSVDCVMPYQFNVDIMGDKGSIRDNLVWSKVLMPSASAWTEVPAILPNSGDVAHHPFEGEISELIDAILTNRRPCPDIEDAVQTHEVCLAMDMSVANGGARVDLPLIRD
jgi:predicted dehydrogenase